MRNHLKSASSGSISVSRPDWVKWGILAVASAVAGGVATAWWYRKTLRRLHEQRVETGNPNFGMRDGEEGEE